MRAPEARKRHFVWKFTGTMPHTTPPTSIKHRAFCSYRKNPFSVATVFGEKLKLSSGYRKKTLGHTVPCPPISYLSWDFPLIYPLCSLENGLHTDTMTFSASDAAILFTLL